MPVTISEEPIADEEEVGGGPCNLEILTNQDQIDILEEADMEEAQTKAACVIQAFFRGQ